MTAFDRAWTIIKMAAYKVGPTEFWDTEEFLDRNWYEEGEDGEHPRQFPMGGRQGHRWSKYHNVMMKPQDYLRLVSPINEYRGKPPVNMYGTVLQDYIKDNPRTDSIMEAMKRGKPAFIPTLDYKHEKHGSRVSGHEGRHRMAAILQLLGNRPVPVQLAPASTFYESRPFLLRGESDPSQELDFDLDPSVFDVGDVE
mgnify:CR=1 FL=1|tara:strand:+ start:54 stop:644 length:591 start_codon:yes stop_codon:yes gene_type:complete